MALLYFGEQLVAKSDVPGVLSTQLINEEIVITCLSLIGLYIGKF